MGARVEGKRTKLSDDGHLPLRANEEESISAKICLAVYKGLFLEPL